MKATTRLLVPTIVAIVLTAIAIIALARGADAAGGVAVTQAWARATPPGASVGAAYVTIENGGSAADRLVGVSSPAAEELQIHETVEENGVAQMRPLERPRVPPGGTLEMRPGGTHLMLMGLAAPLKEGDSFELTLAFENAGPLTVEAKVAAIGAETPPVDD